MNSCFSIVFGQDSCQFQWLNRNLVAFRSSCHFQCIDMNLVNYSFLTGFLSILLCWQDFNVGFTIGIPIPFSVLTWILFNYSVLTRFLRISVLGQDFCRFRFFYFLFAVLTGFNIHSFLFAMYWHEFLFTIVFWQDSCQFQCLDKILVTFRVLTGIL